MPDQIQAVQALRAVAALSVTCVHFTAMCLMLMGRVNDPIPVMPMASGVDLFFVISGFIMVISSTKLFGTSRAPVLFLGRRLGRIVPVYWSTTLISIPLLNPAWDTQSLAQSLLFIPYVAADGRSVPVYGIGWTLNFEMFFYLAFSAAIVLRRGLAVMTLSGLMIGLVALGSFVTLPAPMSVWSDPIILEFVMGMIIATSYQKGVRLSSWVCLGLIVAGASGVWFSDGANIPTGPRWFWWGVPAALMMMGATLPVRPWRIPRFVMILGDASYSIYLVHGLVIGALFGLRASRYISHSVPLWQVAVAGEILTILISLASYYLLERPTARFVARQLSGAVRRPVLATAP